MILTMKMKAKKKAHNEVNMCKILAVAGITDKNRKKVWEFVVASNVHMTAAADKDSVGYAAITAKGELFGERWMDYTDAFSYRPTPGEGKWVEDFCGALGPAVNTSYNKFGTLDSPHAVGIILHARHATCALTIENAHPFVRDNIALIHNGVIRNDKELTKLTSTCDSECILNEYVTKDVRSNPNDIQKVVDKLEGYYACGVLGHTEDGPYLDIFKDIGAQLICAKIRELGCTVFCTKYEIVQATCKDLGLTIDMAYAVQPGFLIRMDLNANQIYDIYTYEDNRKPYRGGHGHGGTGDYVWPEVTTSKPYTPTVITLPDGSKQVMHEESIPDDDDAAIQLMMEAAAAEDTLNGDQEITPGEVAQLLAKLGNKGVH